MKITMIKCDSLDARGAGLVNAILALGAKGYTHYLTCDAHNSEDLVVGTEAHNYDDLDPDYYDLDSDESEAAVQIFEFFGGESDEDTVTLPGGQVATLVMKDVIEVLED